MTDRLFFLFMAALVIAPCLLNATITPNPRETEPDFIIDYFTYDTESRSTLHENITQLDKEHKSIYSTALAYIGRKDAEPLGFGLYTYALIPHNSDRASAFIDNLRKTTSFLQRLRNDEGFNVILLPYNSSYNFDMAVSILHDICRKLRVLLPALCRSAMDSGPYLITFDRPIRTISSSDVRYLLLDLSDVHSDAFPEFISVYKAQMKRDDFTDREMLDTLRLSILNLTLTAADWISPVRKAVADIIQMQTLPAK